MVDGIYGDVDNGFVLISMEEFRTVCVNFRNKGVKLKVFLVRRKKKQCGVSAVWFLLWRVGLIGGLTKIYLVVDCG